jgi:hypothetical protein
MMDAEIGRQIETQEKGKKYPATEETEGHREDRNIEASRIICVLCGQTYQSRVARSK